MSILDVIENEHDKHQTLLDIIEKTEGASEGREELWERFKTELKAHAHAEERVFYSELLGDKDARHDAGHSVKEHHEMDALMDEIDKTDMSSPQWLIRFKALADMVRHHENEEEEDVFPIAKEEMSKSEREEIGDEFQAAKKEELKELRDR